ncbi:MAG: HypC/HybG/HupF family hydrogenase formation chaperone [Acidimicrobiia bacterium]
MCVALPGRVTWVGPRSESTIPARVELPTGVVEVDLVLVPDAEIDDYVVAHSGFALRLISQDEAERTLELAGF